MYPSVWTLFLACLAALGCGSSELAPVVASAPTTAVTSHSALPVTLDPEGPPAGQTGPVSKLAFVDAQRLMLLSEDLSQLSLWDVSSRRRIRAWPLGHAVRAAFSADGRFVTSLGDSVGVLAQERIAFRQRALSDGGVLGELRLSREQTAYATAVFALSDGRAVLARAKAAEALDACIRFYSKELSEQHKICPDDWKLLDKLEVSPDGQWIALLTARAIRILDATSGREVKRFAFRDVVDPTVVFSADSSRLAWTTRNGEQHDLVHVIDVDGWKDRARVEVEGYGKRLALSATGHVLAVLSEYRITTVDVAQATITSEQTVRASTRDAHVDAFAVSPDGETMVYVQAGILR